MSTPRPLLIGLTGNISTGKSTVARMLVELGAEVIDADKTVHEVMRAGTPIHTQIVETFGSEILASDGEIDRKRLGAIVFADPVLLAQLEAIVHPATLNAISRRIAATSSDVVVIEAIKLIEAGHRPIGADAPVGMADTCDSVWVTACPAEQRIQRIMAGRGLNRAEAEQRVRAQSPQEEKIARADVVIDTSGTLEWTRTQVRAAWEQLTGRESGARERR
jgi:dephospho-CoA kinase